MMRLRKAFTLIELLVVIAITAILMTIIVVPVIQSFNLTRAAQAWAEAQDKARTLTERIAHEINNASRVRPNDGINGELLIVVPARPGSGQAINGYETSHPWIRVPIFDAKLDIVKPFEGDPSLQANGALINPLAPGGPIADPTLQTPRGQVGLPGSPGMTIVRYFIGLRDPLRKFDPTQANSKLGGYIEPYTGLLEQREGLKDNLYVLYRAEVQPMIWSSRQVKFIVNKKLFYDLGRNTNTGKSGPYYDDPMFFDPTADPAGAYYSPIGGGTDSTPNYNIPDPEGTADPSKAQMIQNWLDASQVQTEVSRFDMIQPIYDLKTRQVTYDGDAPRLISLIQFRPERIRSEPAEGQTAVRPGQETDNPTAIAPDVFVTRFPGWTNTLLRTYANTYNQSITAQDKYLVGVKLPNPGINDPQGFSVYASDPNQAGGPYDDGLTGQIIGGTRVGFELFDGDIYTRGLREGFRANYSRAIASANSRSGWVTNAAWRSIFEPYTPDFERGRVVASYGIDENGVVGSNYPFTPVPIVDPVNNPNNLPGAPTWDSATPAQPAISDPNVIAGVFSSPAYASINKKYNKIWHDYPNLHGSIQRFIDLRVTPNDDGAPSPLDPDPMTGFVRARITPGSEQIFGPDQNPGPNQGAIVRYTRTTRDPGPNQYKINYTDLPEPTDYTLIGGPVVTPPATYTPADFTSAVLQPRYKAGYIQFNSDPNVALPTSKILVYYRFQFTQPNDVMAVDYDSRQLMTVQMTIRDYPQSNLPNPQTITLHSSASVRNYLR